MANITITSRQRAGPRWDIVLKILIFKIRMKKIRKMIQITFLTTPVGSIFLLIRKSEMRENARLQPHIQA